MKESNTDASFYKHSIKMKAVNVCLVRGTGHLARSGKS